MKWTVILLLSLAGFAAACTPETVVPTTDPANVVEQSFAVEVTGATEITMPPGSAAFSTTVGTDVASPGVDQLVFMREDDGMQYTVFIRIPAELEAGTFELGEIGDVTLDPYTAAFTTLEIDCEVETEECDTFSYQNALMGEITLTEFGQFLSGEFSFSAGRVDDPEVQVTVNGAFEDIPYLTE